MSVENHELRNEEELVKKRIRMIEDEQELEMTPNHGLYFNG